MKTFRVIISTFLLWSMSLIANATIPPGTIPPDARWRVTNCVGNKVYARYGQSSPGVYDSSIVLAKDNSLDNVVRLSGYTDKNGVYSIADATMCFYSYPNHFWPNGSPMGPGLYWGQSAQIFNERLRSDNLVAHCRGMGGFISANFAKFGVEKIDPDTGAGTSTYITLGASSFSNRVFENPKAVSAACIHEVTVPGTSERDVVMPAFYQLELTCQPGTAMHVGSEVYKAADSSERAVYPKIGDDLKTSGGTVMDYVYCSAYTGETLIKDKDKNPPKTRGDNTGDVGPAVIDGADDIDTGAKECRP